MSLTSHAASILFSLYREAETRGDQEAMTVIRAATEAMEAAVAVTESTAAAFSEELRMEDGHGESVSKRIPLSKRLSHPEGSGIVIAGCFVSAEKVAIVKPSRRKAASSIQATLGRKSTKGPQRVAKWLAIHK